MTKRLDSWVASANAAETEFPLNNLPYGVFSQPGEAPRCGVAIGDQILDVAALAEKGLAAGLDACVFAEPSWNRFMELGRETWSRFRKDLQTALAAGSDRQAELAPLLTPMEQAKLHMPFTVAEFTDFYASRHHAQNVGSMFRDPANALPPNWLHIPIGYNGRASSVVVSGTDVTRPHGQLKGPNDALPRFALSQRFDMELEMGAIVGKASSGRLSVQEAFDNIFGYVLLNDWSARDIQAWEYQPLGPFQAKATATSISPWIVTAEALAPFRTACPERVHPLLPHIKDDGPMLYNIEVEAELITPEGARATITRTNYSEMYYSAAQQLAHHSSSGCPMRVGDLLGSGTISGPERENRGSLLELSWGGKDPINLSNGETRSFLQDGDEIVLTGHAKAEGYKIGFGQCAGRVAAA